MVKANSYGSGSYEIANMLQFHGADYLAVAYADEGIALRKKRDFATHYGNEPIGGAIYRDVRVLFGARDI